MADIPIGKASTLKWALCVVLNPDLTVNRSYRISRTEIDKVHAIPNGVPPGMTVDEWTAKDKNGRCLAYIDHKDFDTGDIAVESDGSLTLKYDETIKNNQVVEKYHAIPSNKWNGQNTAISISADALPDSVLSIVNGVIVNKPTP